MSAGLSWNLKKTLKKGVSGLWAPNLDAFLTDVTTIKDHFPGKQPGRESSHINFAKTRIKLYYRTKVEKEVNLFRSSLWKVLVSGSTKTDFLCIPA